MIQGSIVQTCVVLATLNLVLSLFHTATFTGSSLSEMKCRSLMIGPIILSFNAI